MIKTIEWTTEGVVMIDQTKLPAEEVYLTCRDYQETADAIRNMVIRGAPAIGVAAAMGVARGVCDAVDQADATVAPEQLDQSLDQSMETICETLAATRPTAVNLFWAIERMKNLYGDPAHKDRVEELRAELKRHRDRLGDDRSVDGTPLPDCGRTRMKDL